MIADSVELLKLLLSRGIIFLFGFSAGFFSAVCLWVLCRVLPRIDSYVHMIEVYHKFRIKNETSKFLLAFFAFLSALLLVTLFIYVLVEVSI